MATNVMSLDHTTYFTFGTRAWANALQRYSNRAGKLSNNNTGAERNNKKEWGSGQTASTRPPFQVAHAFSQCHRAGAPYGKTIVSSFHLRFLLKIIKDHLFAVAVEENACSSIEDFVTVGQLNLLASFLVLQVLDQNLQNEKP